ncbi:FtsX-like permease family protein [Heliobacillus mobilis]|uniref:Cell division protein FtsX n=2 Tax=Heliobacterium TaxID=2697 RepID=A0A6I3SL56_HELMO|nr:MULTISPECIES: permease-like cell division protein FtsX [Heliobacterium]MBC9784442.1 ABC transporter permease [Heliobacterium chlorum]MTV49630.1 FtsX-like permease family protein [Heliobacterium mobile]
MRMRTVGYFFRESFRSLWKNGWMSIASISTVAISLLILGISLLLVMNSNNLVTTMESELEVLVAMRTDIDAKQIQAVGDKLRSHSKVNEVTFVSKNEAMATMKKQLGDRSDMFKALGDANPFPDMYRVKAKDPNDVSSLAEEFNKYPGVEKVRYGQGFVEKLLSLTEWIRMVGLSIMFLIGAASVFLISTTIRLTVFARRKEINIMKFVGATNWFIRWPFLLEGTFLGLFGSLIAVGLLYGIYAPVTTYVESSLPFVPLRSDASFLMTIFEIVMGTGILIGAMGSVISLRKFLKV